MLEIDHIVIATKDPARAAAEFGKQHHVVTLEGGRHTKWGTYNYLAYFSNGCYIEWLGIFETSLARKSDNPLVQQLVKALASDFEGAIQFALRTDQMDNYLERFTAGGIAYTGPIHGNRQKPDGTTLAWRMLFPDLHAGTAPFLIEWGTQQNMPPNEDALNKQQIKSIGCGLAADVAKKIYLMNISGNIIQLGNGKLDLQGAAGITFEIN